MINIQRTKIILAGALADDQKVIIQCNGRAHLHYYVVKLTSNAVYLMPNLEGGLVRAVFEDITDIELG